jgi:hypothetical protein
MTTQVPRRVAGYSVRALTYGTLLPESSRRQLPTESVLVVWLGHLGAGAGDRFSARLAHQ